MRPNESLTRERLQRGDDLEPDDGRFGSREAAVIENPLQIRPQRQMRYHLDLIVQQRSGQAALDIGASS